MIDDVLEWFMNRRGRPVWPAREQASIQVAPYFPPSFPCAGRGKKRRTEQEKGRMQEKAAAAAQSSKKWRNVEGQTGRENRRVAEAVAAAVAVAAR